MKKVYDWNIKLLIRVQNNSKTIEIVCSVHTNIHQLKLQLTKKLNLLIFDTDIDIYNISSARPLKPTSTLIQNGIQKNTALSAIVVRTKENRKLDLEGTQKNPKNEDKNAQSQVYGLSILCSCINKDCVNYGSDMWINYGYGSFPLLQLISHTKCETCPYRTQYLRPNMICKEIRVSKGHYRGDGTQDNSVGIPVKKQLPYIKITKQKDIRKVIDAYKWKNDFILTVKHL